ncbi:MAG: serine/threonine-protein kinase [Byssovorax sp.]
MTEHASDKAPPAGGVTGADMPTSRDPDEGVTVTEDGELLAALGMRAAPAPRVPARGQVIDGAYRVERALGAGGMGVVFLARDLRLARDIAVKLHAARSGEPGGERLIREATALAQLTHPHVVTVHRVGVWSGHPYVAMEYVAGGTARSWLATPRAWPEILRLYVRAGQGLSAAHAAGLVHRDFKPDNVLVGDDGRVKVADFGLARAIEERAGAAPLVDGAGDVEEALPPITRTGARMGTPAYMAPEQRSGARVGPEADQFAYAVSLWEALCGKRPFEGETHAELTAAIEAGRVGDAPPEVPAAVTRALVRAMSADPAARWPSMDALLDALSAALPDPAARRRRIGVAAAAGILALGAAIGVGLLRPAGPGDRCARAADRLGEAWTPARREAIRAAFAASGAKGQEIAFQRVAARLDAYAEQWAAQRAEACEATWVRHEQSEQTLDLQNHCLDQRRLALGALATMLAGADAAVVGRALEASLALPGLADCADVPALSGAPALPRDPAERAAMESVEAELARSRALLGAGRFQESLEVARAAIPAADALPRTSLGAEARFRVAVAQGSLRDRAAARAGLEQALKAAAQARDDAFSALVAVTILDLVVSVEEDLVEAERLLVFATAAVKRAGSRPIDEADLASAAGNLRAHQGKHAEARAELERAVALYERADRSTYAGRLVSALNRLGGVLGASGDIAAARGAYARAISTLEATFGPDHLRVAGVLNNLATLALEAHEPEEARGLLERAIVIKERNLGPDHPELASSLANLAATLVALGRPADARPPSERALALVEKKLGPDHPFVARALSTRADVLSALGDRAGARADLDRAIGIQRATLGETLELAETLVTRAGVLLDGGDRKGARADLDLARSIFAKTAGLDGPKAAKLRAALARLDGGPAPGAPAKK